MRVPRTLLRGLTIGVSAVATLVPAYTASADPTPTQVQAQIESASNELEDVVEAYNGLNENLKASQAGATDVAARVGTLTSQVDAAQRDVQTIASAAYKGSGNLMTLTMIIGAGSTQGFVDQITTLKHVTRAQQRDIDQYLRVKTDLDKESRRYADLISQQTDQQRQLADRKATIEGNIRSLETLKLRVSAPPPTRSARPKTPPPAVSGSAGAAVAFAHAQLDKPYVWGASGPNSYDCSGLTKAAWRHAGVSLLHNARQQWGQVAHIERESLRPGDLVFYRGLKHVAIYIGNGEIIHAPHAGDLVKVADADIMKPYGYGRPG